MEKQKMQDQDFNAPSRLEQAKVVCEFLMSYHGLTDLGWTFAWNNRKNDLGVCDFGKRTIQLSKLFAETRDPDSTLNTIKHEIAHALVGVRFSGRRRIWHGEAWRNKMIEIGGNPSRTTCVPKEEHHNKQSKYVVCHKQTGKIYCEYDRAMSFKRRNKIHKMFIPGQKLETYGKLTFLDRGTHEILFGDK